MKKKAPVTLPEEIARFFDEAVGRDRVGAGQAMALMLEEIALKDKYVRYFQAKYGDTWQFVIADCARYGWDFEEELYYVVLPGVTGELSNGVNLAGYTIGVGGHKFRLKELDQIDKRYRQFAIPVNPI